MPPKKEQQTQVPVDDVQEEEEITLDMSKAKTFEPLPERRPFLAAVSKWQYGKTANGRKLDYELTIIEPTELANRKVPESLSLENEYTLGRYQTMLIALGFKEEDVKSKTFKSPKSDDVMGLQATIYCRTRKSETFGDRSQISRFALASSYKPVAEAAQY